MWERRCRCPTRHTLACCAPAVKGAASNATRTWRRSNVPSRLNEKNRVCPYLFDLDLGLADDRPPLLGLGLVECGEALGRLQLARGDVEPEVGEALLDGRLGERGD